MKRITREQAFTHGGAVITEAEQEEGLFPLMVEGNALDPNIRAPTEEVEAGSRKGVLIRSTRRFKAPKR